jgi:hypothetical protein
LAQETSEIGVFSTAQQSSTLVFVVSSHGFCFSLHFEYSHINRSMSEEHMVARRQLILFSGAIGNGGGAAAAIL